MADFRQDQAAGLRRLFGRNQLRVVSFVSGTGGVGKTSVVANAAVALARQGREVLVVDENAGANHMGAFFGLQARGDLLQVFSRQKGLDDVLLSPQDGLHILPAARAAHQLGKLTPAQQQAWMEGMQALARPVDVILVDTCNDHPHGFSPWGLAAGETVVVLSGGGTAITDSYALIKKVSLAFARRHFRILVNKVKCLEDGQVIHGNLRKVAAQRGLAHLEYGGAVPLDESLRQVAQLCQPIVSTLPETPAAQALREFAADMLYWPTAEYENGGVEQFIQQLLHLSHRISPRVLQA